MIMITGAQAEVGGLIMMMIMVKPGFSVSELAPLACWLNIDHPDKISWP